MSDAFSLKNKNLPQKKRALIESVSVLDKVDRCVDTFLSIVSR